MSSADDQQRIEAIRAQLAVDGGFVGYERENQEWLLDLVERQQRDPRVCDALFDSVLWGEMHCVLAEHGDDWPHISKRGMDEFAKQAWEAVSDD